MILVSSKGRLWGDVGSAGDGSADLMGSEVRPCMYTVNGFKLMMIEDGEVDPALAIAPPASEGKEEKEAKVHERMPTLFR